MILIDTSIWVDHLRTGNLTLVRLLETGEVLAHPFVIGELSLGDLRQRQLIPHTLLDLPQAMVPLIRKCCISSTGTGCSAPLSAMSMPIYWHLRS